MIKILTLDPETITENQPRVRRPTASIFIWLSVSDGLLNSKCGELLFHLSFLLQLITDWMLAGCCAEFGPFGHNHCHTIKGFSNCDLSQKFEMVPRSLRHTVIVYSSEEQLHLEFLDMHSGTTYYFHYFLYFTTYQRHFLVFFSRVDWVTQSYIMCFCSPCCNQPCICASMCSSEPWSVSFSSLRLAYHVPIRADCECGRNDTAFHRSPTVLWSVQTASIWKHTFKDDFKGVYIKCILVERKHCVYGKIAPALPWIHTVSTFYVLSTVNICLNILNNCWLNIRNFPFKFTRSSGVFFC